METCWVKPLEIAGWGSAGLAPAAALKRIGHKIHLFDQFDDPRPLGSGLMMQPAGLDALDWLGLGDHLRSLGAPIDRLYGRDIHSGRVVLDVVTRPCEAAETDWRCIARRSSMSCSTT
jgi:2-polyprenyl-6-methoxyphenol hydroxylase-like FAD-dependent oxidoreductase